MIQGSGKEIPKGTILVNAFFCATLFPFLSPLPIETDTQPVSLILAAIIILINSLKGKKFTYVEALIILFPLIGLIYINPFISDENPIISGKYLSLVAGSLVYVAALRWFHLFSSKVFYYSFVCYFIFSICIIISPDISFRIQALFVRAVNTAGDENPLSYRGIPTFSTEPGLLGGVLIYHLFILDYFKKKGEIIGLHYKVALLMLVFMILATKSGTGYLYFFLYIGYVILRQKNGFLKAGGALGASIFVVFIIMSTVDKASELGRGFEILSALMNPDILMLDTSTVGRWFDFCTGFVSLINFPFGNGVNGVNEATLYLTQQYHFLNQYYGTTVVGLVSGLAWCFVAYGIFAVIYFPFIYLSTTRANIGSRIFSLIFLSFSYSPAFPGIWVLLAQPPIKRLSTGKVDVSPSGADNRS